MLDLDIVKPSSLRPLRREEYERLVELGYFADEKIELLRGMIVEKSPQGSMHADVVDRLLYALLPPLMGRARVRVQSPYSASEDSLPEPDLFVIPIGDYSRMPPDRAFLMIEVAASSLRLDRKIKAPLYAEAGVPEYWLFDLEARRVEVYREPSGGVYQHVETFGRDATIHPLAFPDVVVDLAAVLPAAE